jgi:Arc/MetJ-type ribon-helix-helix transcriptional regulator
LTTVPRWSKLNAEGTANMSTNLSPENEQFIENVVACGMFEDREQVLESAVALLRRQQLLEHIDEGTRQLRDGKGIELRGEHELRAFFDEIKAEGMRR